MRGIKYIPQYRAGRNSLLSSPAVQITSGLACEKWNAEHTQCLKRFKGGLIYKGGDVLKEPKVYLIFWGSNWNTEADKRWQGALVNTLKGMTTEWGFNTTYQRILHQYGDEATTEPHQISETVTVNGEYVYEGAPAAQNMGFENVELQINYAIETKKWPREHNSLFLVMAPTGTVYRPAFAEGKEKNYREEEALGGQGWCGFHEHDRWGDTYAFLPNLDEAKYFREGCVESESTTVQHAETETASHEYMEAVTDPHSTGWFNEQGYEIADICDEHPEMVNEALSIYVSAVWGNHENECVVKDPPESPPAPPTATTEAATGISFHQATLNGAVNPSGGPEPHYYFEYGTSTSYGSDSPAPPGPGVGYGTSAVPVTTALTGLKSGTKYHYRLNASTWAGTGYGADKEFTTPIPPPVAITETPTEVGDNHATLRGVVNPEEFSTTYQFEYWPAKKTSEVKEIPVAGESVGSGGSNIKVTQKLTGLSKYTEYTYRLVATNAGGTSRGAEVQLLTGPFMDIQATPNQPGATENVLKGISCSSSIACSSVGFYKNSSGTEVVLAQVWNGTEWKLQSVPAPSGALASGFGGVSCSSSTACTGVGSYTNSSGVVVTLAERWNGTGWAIQSTPNPSGSIGSVLSAVSCSSATACTAAGYYINGSGRLLTLAEKWNGTEWTIQATPNEGGTINLLDGVSCTSASACTAVGTVYGGTLVERWSGTEWVIQKKASGTEFGSADLTGVSCTTATACTAVGRYTVGLGGRQYNLAEGWNGTEWTVQSAPEPSGASSSELAGVSCSSSKTCTAVGEYKNSAGTELTLGEGWNGAEWALQSTSNPTGAKQIKLLGVSCSSVTACMAAGSDTNSAGTTVTLAEDTGP